MASRTFAYGFVVFGFAVGILGLLLLLHKDYDEQSEQLSKTGSGANLKRQEQTIGHWTEWTNQPCSFSDSGCFVIVLAKCNKPSADADCLGFGYHLINCTAENCPAIWTEWTTGKDNNDMCIHKRERNCTGIPSAPSCASRDTDTMFCNTSEWSMWGKWTCHLDQYDKCLQYRSRECYVGLDRKQCQGENSQLVPCTMEHCKGFLQPVWSEWTDPICLSDSNGCFIVRNRTCSAGSDSHCNNRSIDIQPCGVNDCIATWLPWSHWECSRSHGQYVANRIRHCSTGRADDCKGKPYDSMSCGLVECPECQILTTPQPIQGSWLEWSHWECLDNTSIVARRVRNCSTGDEKDCDGRPYLLAICSATECPECYKDMTSSTELTSVITTITTTTTVEACEDADEIQCAEPDFRDIVCKDVSLAERFCRKTCKRCVPTWYPWTSWECNSKFGLMFQTRHRKCNSTGCAGDSNELIYCNQSECPECFKDTSSSIPPPSSTSVTVLSTKSTVHQASSSTDSTLVTGINPTWSAWTHFECSISHGLAFRIRYRYCNTTGCTGDSNEIYFCDQTACPECYLNEVLDTCRDESDDVCKEASFQSLVCNDTSLAKRHCQKTCNLCVPQAACRDGSGCDSQLQSIACNDPTISILCPVACGLCTPTKCEDVPRCNEELGSLVCKDPKFEALCPVRCGVCTRNITIDTTRAPENTNIPPLTVQTTIVPKPTIVPVGTPKPINPTFAMTAAPVTPNNTITTDRQKSTISYTDITTVNRDKTSRVTTRELDTTTTSTLTSVTNGSNRTSTRVTGGTDDPNGQDASISSVSTPSKTDITSTLTEKITSVTTETPNVTDKIFISTKDGQIKPMTTSATDGINNSTMTSSKASNVTTVQTRKTDSTSFKTTAAADFSSSSTVAGLTSTQKQNTDTISTGKTTAAETKTTTSMTTRTTNAPTTVEKTTEAATTVSKITVSTTIAKTTIPTKTIPPTTNPSTTVLETSLPPTTVAKTTIPTRTIPPTTHIPTTVRKTTHPPTTNTPTTVFKTTYPPTTNIPTTALKITNPPTTNTPTTIPQTTPRPTTFPPTTAALTTRAGGGGHTISPDPTQCAVCVGPPELCDQLYEIQTCAPPNNYCINHVKNYEDGSRDVVRTCGNHRTCYREWFQGSSDNDKCQNFVEDNVITLSFECTYCCIKNECNIKLYPDIDTLYKDV